MQQEWVIIELYTVRVDLKIMFCRIHVPKKKEIILFIFSCVPNDLNHVRMLNGEKRAQNTLNYH